MGLHLGWNKIFAKYSTVRDMCVCVCVCVSMYTYIIYKIKAKYQIILLTMTMDMLIYFSLKKMIVRLTVLLCNTMHSNQTIQSPQVPVSNQLSKTMIFYLAIRKNKIILAENWMKVKINMLSEKACSTKKKVCFLSCKEGKKQR